ncbi:AAA family ATPase [Pedobacter frigiditerrae]|uniref:AAA family ATPase n=1 Tax=Pedobacter frigiditerrae TaxID=2530452 RepID=UPI00292E3497|nr:DUF3696 domain-containing protein [Pedobacter frigiditerrae]
MTDLKLTLSDFKAFEGETISFKGLTVFAGVNSAGKSTIIQALLILRMTIEEKERYNIQSGRIRVPLNGRYNLELGNTSEIIRRTKRIADSSMSLKLEGDNNSIDIKYFGDRATQTVYELTTDEYVINGHRIDILHPYFYYLCAERIGPRLKYEYEVQPFDHVGYRGENTFQILSGENVKISQIRTLEQLEDGLLFGEARKWLEYIIPGANFNAATLIGRSRVIEGTFSDSLPTNVGFGISYVLPIIVNGLIAAENSMFIIENPEAHLHPMGQSRIGVFLAQISACGVRVIIETHSEHIINGIRLSTLKGIVQNEEVIVNFISRSEENKPDPQEISISKLGDLTDYPRGFFDQEQFDIAEMIIEKRKKT